MDAVSDRIKNEGLQIIGNLQESTELANEYYEWKE